MDLIKPIVDSLITIGAEDEPEDPEDDSVARTAFRCLDTLSTSLSPQAVSLPSSLGSKSVSPVRIPPYERLPSWLSA
ncbi:hypothetical protein H4Q26_010281 [Puccinia striiformis f. sp. tritici PST-130]|nr:hypothetical protein H4Q26_010281 [Puccinia striiformis f. sp. tritici PST-130]